MKNNFSIIIFYLAAFFFLIHIIWKKSHTSDHKYKYVVNGYMIPDSLFKESFQKNHFHSLNKTEPVKVYTDSIRYSRDSVIIENSNSSQIVFIKTRDSLIITKL